MIGTGAPLFDHFIEGDPKPQARPVAWPVRLSGRWQARMGEDKAAPCVPWRKHFAVLARVRMSGDPAPRATPLACELRFVFERPKSHRRMGGGLRSSAPETATSRDLGDLDNLAKAVLDELEGIVFENDSSIVEMLLSKRYARLDEEPGVRVTVREWVDPAPRPPRPLGVDW